ncbi:hypothetical protein [Pseudomonas sp. dw_612]|uniref:hypothetical protein n=1 Tax=Pseudomonas sp. dw_612 TaxID=2720080 RepID=UPI001BD1EB11|nr:hypothetical protein [Pseudomonas sp. dw_612]
MHGFPKRLFGVYTCTSFLALLLGAPVFADALDDQKDALEKQKQIALLKQSIAESQKATAEAQKATATALGVGKSADEAAIAASKSATATSNATGDLAEINALKTTLGDPKKIGVDGSIAFTTEAQNIMLQSRQGGIAAVRDAADEICSALTKNAQVRSAVGLRPLTPGTPLPPPASSGSKTRIVALSEARLTEMVAAKLRMSRFTALYDTVKNTRLEPPERAADVKGSKEDTWFAARNQMVLGLQESLMAAQYLMNGVDNIAGAFRTDKTFNMVTTTAREDLFESRLSACWAIFDPRSLARKADRDRLKTTIEEFAKKVQFMQDFAAEVATKRREFDALPKSRQTITQNLQIKTWEALAARVNALTIPDAQLLTDLALTSMESVIREHPVMTYALSVQDTQILKKRWLLNNKISFQGTAEVVYQVTNIDGTILDGDAVSVTSQAEDIASTKGVKPR